MDTEVKFSDFRTTSMFGRDISLSALGSHILLALGPRGINKKSLTAFLNKEVALELAKALAELAEQLE